MAANGTDSLQVDVDTNKDHNDHNQDQDELAGLRAQVVELREETPGCNTMEKVFHQSPTLCAVADFDGYFVNLNASDRTSGVHRGRAQVKALR